MIVLLRFLVQLLANTYATLKRMLCDCCTPTVLSKCGEVKGSRMKTAKGERIFSFRGIPYAKPPVGERRFRRTELFGAWRGAINAKNEAKKSLQPNVLFPEIHAISEGQEDCLYLNVYTKSLDENAKQPVIVFLHGGAFVVGSCESTLYGPQILLDKDVVLVGVNYRLGILGFLSLETEEAPGNLGLHDQTLALQWIKENIQEFGGDPDRVTLMGESAGSMSALLHLVSPFSKGLFSRVIALSGTPSSAFLHKDRSPRMYALEVAKKLGCTQLDDPDQVLKFLQAQKAFDILKTSTMFMDWDHAHPMPWTPVIDSYAKEPIVPRYFNEAVESGAAADVPVIIGTCKDEGLIITPKFFRDTARWSLLTKEWSVWAPLLLFNRERDCTTQEDREEVEKLRKFYFADQESLPHTEENVLKLTDMCTMGWFLCAAEADTNLLVKNGIKVYRFILNSPPNFTLFDLFRLNMIEIGKMFTLRRFFGYNPYKKEYGTCHADDLCYLFPLSMPGFPKYVVTDLQKKTQQRLLEIVSTFVSTGTPSLEEIKWSNVTETNRNYLDLGSSVQMTRDAYMDQQLELWMSVMEKQRERRTLSNKPFTSLYNKAAVLRI